MPGRAAIGYQSGGTEETRDRQERDRMANDQLLEEHRRTWKGFVRLITYSAAATVITLALMAIFLL